MTTVFINTHNLSHDILSLRFREYHPEIRFALFTNQSGNNPPVNLVGFQTLPAGILQDADIEAILNTPATPAENTILTNWAIDRAELKDTYQTAIDRLQQIENAASPTNAQVIQAIRDLAKFLRLLLKLLRRII